ncbi:MAG: poly-gamma-glutamate system protein [Myxococcota bacterium]
MKKVYWRPPGISRTALTLVSMVAVCLFVAVERFPVVRKQSSYGLKFAAARLAERGQQAIKVEKQRRGLMPPELVDPARTGMLGESVTPVTSNSGFLDAKRSSTNPNFAAVMIELLEGAEVQTGDTVAVGVSGSFPALNLATYAAIRVLELRPIIIASASSSEWGANHPTYLWLDMERTLRDKDVVPFQVSAASYGGIDDRGVGLTARGRSFIANSMRRNDVTLLEPTSLEDAIDLRMARFDELAGDAEIAAYINVGGGSASVGTHVGKKQFQPGLNLSPPRVPNLADSVMLRFAERDVPVIHLSRVKLLCERYGLPYGSRQREAVGQGSVFVRTEYDLRLAGGGLVAVVVMMLAFLRGSLGSRLVESVQARKQKDNEPTQMV